LDVSGLEGRQAALNVGAGLRAALPATMDQRRALRVSETIREEISEIIGFEMEDPRLAGVNVTDVQVAPDLRHAQVRVSLSGSDREQEIALQALDGARHYLRHELARRLNLRRMPELHFEKDLWQETVQRVDVLLRRAKKTRSKAENQP
jgi:ribosome-binding factor A